MKFIFIKNKLMANRLRYRRDTGYALYTAILPLLSDQFKAEVVETTDEIGDDTFIVNWGNSKDFYYGRSTILNNPSAISRAVDKRNTLSVLRDYSIPTLKTLTKGDAFYYYTIGEKVFVRTKVKARGGEGIIIADKAIEPDFTLETFPDAPLYTLGFDCNREYRYHVFNGMVFMVQEKRKMSRDKLEQNNIEEVDPQARNWGNGWVFCKENVKIHPEIRQSCIQAAEALGLNFAAFDVLVKEKKDKTLIKFAICEANTAPGIEGSGIESYAKVIASAANAWLFNKEDQ